MFTREYPARFPTIAEANSLPWPEFVDRLTVLSTVPLPGDLTAVLSAKSLTWSDRDVNVYLGAFGRRVRYFLDLSAEEFECIFGWHLRLARMVSEQLGEPVYITHGFNPDDSMPGLHSVREKFHTHIHIPQRWPCAPIVPGELSRYELLELVEPFSRAFFDRAVFYRAGNPGDWRLEHRSGFLRLIGPATEIGWLYGLLDDLYRTCADAESALADIRTESCTGHRRYVPRPRPERLASIAALTDRHSPWLSAESRCLLEYLAHRLLEATPRAAPESADFHARGQTWLAKGPCGAFNFVVDGASPWVRFDFAPRVLTTSGAIKILADRPTLVSKGRGAATAAERARMCEFQRLVVTAARRAHQVTGDSALRP